MTGFIARKVNGIMNDAGQGQQHNRALVADVFRLMERDHGKTYTLIAKLARLPASTVGTWARGEACMPLWAFWELARHIPDDLLTLISERSGKAVVTLDDGGEGSLADLGREAAGFTASYVDAVSDGSVTPHERASLNHRRRRLACVAGRAA